MSGLKKLDMAEDATLEELPLRVISSGYDDYVSGPRFADALPQGTNWVRYPHTDLPASNPLVEVLEPATLKALLSRTAVRVERVTAKGVLHHWKGSVLRVESDTRYSTWGRQVTVLLPLKSEVLDQEQLEGKVPYQVPGAWN